MRVKQFACLMVMLMTAAIMHAQGTKVLEHSFNADNVILPSSQYTPDSPYDADVWVYNKGERYESSYYNHIWGEPDADANGLAWYETDYELTDGAIQWLYDSRSPFSSDENYKGQKSFRWVTSDIMGEIYMRRTFELSSLPNYVYLACGHDDAPSEWYINGVKVHSVTDGWNNDEYVLLTDEQRALLHTDGTPNVLAVHVHQNWGGAFADCGLYGADTREVTHFLTTVRTSEWPCVYYQLNNNDDLEVAESGKWYSMEEDESDWMPGKGPFSNDENMFLVTQWQSTVHPLLVRRHFTLDAADMQTISLSDVILSVSYDENPKVYLNGTQIWSANGWNDNNYAEVKLSDEQKDLLKQGDNVLAISIAQGGGGGHVDYGLMTRSEVLDPTVIASVKNDNPKVTKGVYDLSGRYLGPTAKGLAKGVYIIDGRKRFVE